MRSPTQFLAALVTALSLTACGGSSVGAGEQTPKATFTTMVSFGDSLSDVGSYRVGTLTAVGGGKYTVNSTSAKNWTEIVSAVYGLPEPCSAQTGLDGSAAAGLSVPVTDHPACLNYAQGGARIIQPIGPGNKLLGGSNATLGQLTVPLVKQMANHLARVGGAFSGNELVTVFAGGNDLFMQMAAVGAAADGGANAVQLGVVAGWTTGADALATTLLGGGPAAATTAAAQAVSAMGSAGAALAALVNTQLAAKGARKILVLNLGKASKTPYGLAQTPDAQGLIDLLTTTFNDQLRLGLTGTQGVVLVDCYTESTAQATNPGPYGLSDVSTPVCDKSPARNFLGGTALACTDANVIAGDVSHYLYADDVHPTPFGYQLLAKLVLFEMVKAGWL